MSLKSAMCPGCGAQIRFESMASLVVVCESCRFASYRRDLDLEKIGKVGEIAPIDSPIELRMRGVLGGRRFSVKGLVQLDHGRGPWNEWSIEFDDGTRAWLAEAQGQYLVTREQRSGELPTYEQLKAGERIDLGAAGEWVIAERGTGRVVALAGELAADIRPGQTVRYADLGGPDDGFGTLDFGEGSVVRTVYLGRRHGLAELGLELLQRYENKGMAEVLTASEPFVQTGRVKLENLKAEYERRIQAARVKRAPAEMPANR